MDTDVILKSWARGAVCGKSARTVLRGVSNHTVIYYEQHGENLLKRYKKSVIGMPLRGIRFLILHSSFIILHLKTTYNL